MTNVETERGSAVLARRKGADGWWERAFSEGTLTAIRSVRAALPLLRRAPWARIVNLTAMSTQHQTPRLIAYTASKAALASITKNLARTLRPRRDSGQCDSPWKGPDRRRRGGGEGRG